MKKVFEKHETLFCILLIIAYIIVNSYCIQNFGIGHIINLLNGADLIPTLMQICYAISIGYLFVIIFYKSKSLIPCIITHSVVNSLSIFNVENLISLYVSSMFLIIVPLKESLIGEVLALVICAIVGLVIQFIL